MRILFLSSSAAVCADYCDLYASVHPDCDSIGNVGVWPDLAAAYRSSQPLPPRSSRGSSGMRPGRVRWCLASIQ